MTNLAKSVVLLALAALIPAAAHAEVWKTTQQWSPDAEAAYQDWLLHNLDKNIFNRPGPLHGVKLDCADSVYSMRMLFSYQSGLPFVIRDGTAKGTITNEMSRFDNVPAGDARLRAFATFVYNVTDTHTLPGDSFPPALNREDVHGGCFMRSDPANHHSWSVQQIDDTGIPHLFFASRPARTTLSQRNYIPTMGFMFPKGNKPTTEAGFRMWRHPEDVLKSEWQVPGYSLEQYQIPIGVWIKTVQQKLQVVTETAEQHVIRTSEAACQEAQDRVGVVGEGLAYLKSMGARSCMTSSEFDDYSTPSKDARTKAAFQDFAAAYTAAGNGADLSPAVRQRADSILAGEASAEKPDAFCPVTIAPGRTLTLGQVYDRSIHDRLSSNPLEKLEIRWGDKSGPSARAKSCPKY